MTSANAATRYKRRRLSAAVASESSGCPRKNDGAKTASASSKTPSAKATEKVRGNIFFHSPAPFCPSAAAHDQLRVGFPRQHCGNRAAAHDRDAGAHADNFRQVAPEIISTASPSFASARMILWISLLAPISTPCVGSSRISSFGFVASHRASETFLLVCRRSVRCLVHPVRRFSRRDRG